MKPHDTNEASPAVMLSHRACAFDSCHRQISVVGRQLDAEPVAAESFGYYCQRCPLP